MPPLKQPVPLKNMAMIYLLKFLAAYCREACSSVMGSLDKFRQGVAFIKRNICLRIPRELSADFHNRFLENIFRTSRIANEDFKSHRTVFLGIIMDREIMGLSFNSRMVGCVNPDDARRIQGLTGFVTFDRIESDVLKCYNLRDLTSLDLNTCDDDHLHLIGENCAKLATLVIWNFGDVTDAGSRALSTCRELRSVHLWESSSVSKRVIEELLSVHKKIREFRIDLDDLHGRDSTVCPSMEILEMTADHFLDEDLSLVTSKFPNLEQLTIAGYVEGDLMRLRHLTRLTCLSLTDFRWDGLEQLLIIIGANISVLELCYDFNSSFFASQSHLDFIFNICFNIEILQFQFRPHSGRQILCIPPFQKLKDLTCYIPSQYRYRQVGLKFKKMSRLEQLSIPGFEMNTQMIKSIILDNEKFPKLRQIKLSDTDGQVDITRIRRIATINNLDLEIGRVVIIP